MRKGHIPFMKLHNRFLMITLLALLVSFWLGVTRASGDEFSVSFSYGSSDVEFLSGYGSWSEVDPFGQVWVPSVASDWEPFTYGNWAWTSDGWLWTSYEPYGWLVYHYGHWDFRPDIGWFWVPGNRWSAATVIWLHAGDYIYWAPAPPPGVYWPQPWEPEPSGFNIWIGVRVGDFDREDVGRYRVHEFPDRKTIDQGKIFNGPPGISTIRKHSTHRIVTQRVYRRKVGWAPHNYDRIIHPRSQQKIIQRWQRNGEGRVYIPRGSPSHRRQQVENKGNQRRSQERSADRGRSGEHHQGNDSGHQERGRRH